MADKHLDGVGLALAGGGWRAFSQVAVLADMEKNGIKTGAVAGTSMGSLVATLVAAGLDSTTITSLMLEMDQAIKDEGILKGVRWHVINAITKQGFIDSSVLERHVADVLAKAGIKTFNDLKMPLALCTVDVINGDLVVFTGTDGYFQSVPGTWTTIADDLDLATCISASAAYPLVVQPVRFLGRTFVDGGCRMNLATPLFDRSSVDAVVGVHMLHTYPAKDDLTVLNVMNKCMSYGSQQLEELYAQAADIAVNIPVPGADTFNPGCGQEVVDFARGYVQAHPIDWAPAKPSFWNLAKRAGVDAIARLFRTPEKDVVQEAEQTDAVDQEDQAQ